MPYSGSSDASLPAAVKRLPRRVREIWVKVFNENYDAENEGVAFRAAWSAARNALKEKQQMSDGKIKSFAELAAIVLHGEPSEKATKTDAGRQYEASAYLIVPDEAEPSGWKVRVEETPGVITRAQLGRAAAALGPSGFRGRTLEASDDEKRGAAKKLIMLYREDGADDADIPSYLWDIADMHGDMAGAQDDEDMEDMEEKAAHPSFVEFKAFEQPDGRTRWTMISSGGFEDRDGEVVSTDFLDSCVDHAEKSGERGPLYVWHVPGSRIGECDTQVVFGRPGFLVESGLFDDTDDGRRAAAYYTEHAKEQGGSIKFLYANRTADGIYMPPGMIIERSVLPRERAAFPWSGLTLKESTEMAKASKEAIDELARVLGEDRAAEIVGDLEEGAKGLQKLGVRFKSVEAEAETPEAVTEPEAPAEAEAAPAETEETEEKAATPEAADVAAPEAEETAEAGPSADEAPAEAAKEATPAPEMALVLDEAALAEIAKQAAGIMERQFTDLITAQMGLMTARLDELHAATKQMSADVEELRKDDDMRVAEKVARLPRATMYRATQAVREEAKSSDGATQESMLDKGKRALYG